MTLRSGNPTLKADTFSLPRARSEEAMTVSGTVNKTGLSILILLVTASLAWNHVFGVATIQPILWGSMIAGLIVALVTVFKPAWAPVTTPAYAAIEGLFLGTLSSLFELRYPGIVINAVSLTFAVLAVLLMAYSSGWIRPSENFKLGIAAATGGIFLVYVVSMGLSFFGKSVPLIHESGLVGIGFSLFVVTIAALNLVLDFDFIETGVEKGAPKYMEWYGAFGLLVTLVWLYLEILRLLAKLQDRRR
ncbi:MAG: Bax inhibitor-1/YccA family protein [Vicinamibacteria bacterium]|nr:Bax inhibitor-1/YccA family protein [Vicinamibacteria bacterium]